MIDATPCHTLEMSHILLPRCRFVDIAAVYFDAFSLIRLRH